LSNLSDHGIITFDYKLKFLNVKPLVLQILRNKPLADLKVSHVPSLLMVRYFSAFRKLQIILGKEALHTVLGPIVSHHVLIVVHVKVM
jgi:hypothetical protein